MQWVVDLYSLREKILDRTNCIHSQKVALAEQRMNEETRCNQNLLFNQEVPPPSPCQHPNTTASFPTTTNAIINTFSDSLVTHTPFLGSIQAAVISAQPADDRHYIKFKKNKDKKTWRGLAAVSILDSSLLNRKFM